MKDLLLRTVRLLAQGSRADPRERALLIREIRSTINHELDERERREGADPIGF